MVSRFTSYSLSALVLLAMAAPCGRAADEPGPPKIVRVFPLGGQVGTEVAVEILGSGLANSTGVEFDCTDLAWRKTTESKPERVEGVIAIRAGTPLGPHLFRIVTRDGYSTSAMFNVDQYPSAVEKEPNEKSDQAQRIENLPVEIQGKLDGAADIDVFAVEARRGERLVFDLRSIEEGSAVEARMILLDERGRRVDFNDDRDDYNESPRIEHTFAEGGRYFVKLDQYRGPRGFNFGKNCAYILRISSLPSVRFTFPLGLKRGRRTRMRIYGSGLEKVRSVYLTEARRGEYARMTFPYTMPVQFRADPPSAGMLRRVPGRVKLRKPELLEASFAVPPDARLGLWKMWVASEQGTAEGLLVEVSDWREFDEAQAAGSDWTGGGLIVNGALSRPGEKDVFRFQGYAGRPVHFWTLAAQLGIPRLDSVLELRDAAGKKLAENDDVVAGQGTLIGNPDSSLFYTPKEDGALFLTVSDRVKRGGQDFQYRLKVAGERPGFQLFTTPENFAITRNGTGTIKVHLIREAGFNGEVDVWFEGMPPGVEPPRGRFRADQLFEPNADGADMIIPEISFPIRAPASLQPGTYPIRVFGAAASEKNDAARRVVEAHTTMIMGPLLDAWNFVRRPLPVIGMTIVPGPIPGAEKEHPQTSGRQ